MGSAESKVAAQPLAVVASSGGPALSDGPRRPPPSRPSGTASNWTCNLLRKQNKTTPAVSTNATSGPQLALPSHSSPTIEILKESTSASTSAVAARTNSGPSAQIRTATRGINLQQLTFEELSTQLLKAVKNGDQRLVERIVEIAASKHWQIINIHGMWESTPLIYACQYCHETIALWLLQQGADAHCANEKGVSALLLASLEGMATATQQMLEAPVRATDGQRLSMDAHVGVVYNSVADINVRASPLLAASMNGHESVVRLLLQHGANVNHGVPLLSASGNKAGGSGSCSSAYGRRVLQFPLLAAAKHGHAAVVKLLLQHGAGVGETDGNENHALLMACDAAKEDCALVLLQSPATPNPFAWKRANTHGFTALHYCAAHGLIEAAEYMLKDLQWAKDHGFVNATSSTRQESAVLMAARKKQVGMVRLLLQSGADATLADRGGTTALGVLKRDKRDELVQLWGDLQANLKVMAVAEKRHEKELVGSSDGQAADEVSGLRDTYMERFEDKPVPQTERTEVIQNERQVAKEPGEEHHEMATTSESAEESQSGDAVPFAKEAITDAASSLSDGRDTPEADTPTLSPVPGPLPLHPVESTTNDLEESETVEEADGFAQPDLAFRVGKIQDPELLLPEPLSTVEESDAVEELQDLALTASHKPHGHRSKSTVHNRRPTGFAVEPKPRARSLASFSGSAAASPVEGIGEDEDDDEIGEAADPPTLSAGETRENELENEKLGQHHDPGKTTVDESEKPYVSPTKPVDKQKKKKRHAKKNSSSPRKVKTTIPQPELDRAPEPSPCILERRDAGDLNDDF